MEKLQYISQGNTIQEQELHIRKALDNGIQWVQVRWKNAPENELINLCEISKQLCSEYQSVCIINDHVHLAKEIDADGVHVGLNDIAVEEARLILGENKIIGGTANTLSDVIQRINESCNYIGLGPLRFTTTKEKLSPVLGYEGYQKIIDGLREQSIDIPKIFAIGSVAFEDILPLQEIGIYGVAVSDLITKQPEIINELKKVMI
ncbi:Thiamine-phosphate synthase [Chryseobacterium gleum]|uniref:Thiamine-phosphate synthase n=2 Tax=Chryseobacterium gleum TaxID=250 RepID=A0A448B4L3_CHRGE|nr:thiamine phosphate synthase [Chryseobacterium gleum]EFK37214.1 putative thiamine-phosphate diphosphorylase [Chryseobacterium gleum ATCC 35910]QQY33266.1 thiamine phosphate synthase [Chryseobacterium gleum]VEE09111.1 Thiamine-phosphate synthase [Chryseobacterium gleum]